MVDRMLRITLFVLLMLLVPIAGSARAEGTSITVTGAGGLVNGAADAKKSPARTFGVVVTTAPRPAAAATRTPLPLSSTPTTPAATATRTPVPPSLTAAPSGALTSTRTAAGTETDVLHQPNDTTHLLSQDGAVQVDVPP